MSIRPPPFTSWPSGRLRPVEDTPSIDASHLAWFGVLDGQFDFTAPPWTDWIDRELGLLEQGQSFEALRPVRGMVCLEAADRVSLKIAFEVAADRSGTRVGQQRREVFRLVAVPCPYGGSRWWFECPWCDRRRARLYRRRGLTWECRECAGLTYESRRTKPVPRGDIESWMALDRALDKHDARIRASHRRSLRRSLCRWRCKVREREECRLAWPVQVAGRAAPDATIWDFGV